MALDCYARRSNAARIHLLHAGAEIHVYQPTMLHTKLLVILPVQSLWINMTTAGFLGLMLAFEPNESGIMLRPPRDQKTPIPIGQLISQILLVGGLLLLASFGLFQWELAAGATVAEAGAVVVNVFVIVELFYLFNCRSLTKSFRFTEKSRIFSGYI